MNNDAFTTITTALKNGGIAVVRTDTIYGIIALANNERAVEKVYAAKHRDKMKQCIVLIASSADVPLYADSIERYGVLSDMPTSVIVPASNEPAWLLRGGDSVAYRVVRDEFLNKVIAAVGPVIAPSANPEALPPARTIEQARSYFGDLVDAYIDRGEVPEAIHPSRIIKVNEDGTITDIRS